MGLQLEGMEDGFVGYSWVYPYLDDLYIFIMAFKWLRIWAGFLSVDPTLGSTKTTSKFFSVIFQKRKSMAQFTSVLFGITVGVFPSPRPDSDDHNWYHFSSRLSLFGWGTALGSAGLIRPGHQRTSSCCHCEKASDQRSRISHVLTFRRRATWDVKPVGDGDFTRSLDILRDFMGYDWGCDKAHAI